MEPAETKIAATEGAASSVWTRHEGWILALLSALVVAAAAAGMALP